MALGLQESDLITCLRLPSLTPEDRLAQMKGILSVVQDLPSHPLLSYSSGQPAVSTCAPCKLGTTLRGLVAAYQAGRDSNSALSDFNCTPVFLYQGCKEGHGSETLTEPLQNSRTVEPLGSHIMAT